MYENYKNLLYVYPHQINLGNQKFKNVLLRMFMLSGENWKTDFHAALYKDGGIATALQSTVIYHEKTIPLYHEWKIALPYNITDDHYLLFYFYNLDSETWEKPYFENSDSEPKSKNTGGGGEPFQRIGFTWLPLLNEKSVLHSGKFELPIAMQNSQVKLGFSGLKPNVKTPTCQWLAKAGFQVSLSPISSIYSTQEPKIDAVLQHQSAMEFLFKKQDLMKKMANTTYDNPNSLESLRKLESEDIRVYGTRISPSKLPQALLSSIQNLEFAKNRDALFKFFPQLLNSLLHNMLYDKWNNSASFCALATMVNELAVFQKTNQKDNFQSLSDDNVGLGVVCAYVDKKFNPLLLYNSGQNRCSLGGHKSLTNLRNDNLQKMNQYASEASLASRYKKSPDNQPKTYHQRAPSKSDQSSSKSSKSSCQPPKTTSPTIHHELVHFWCVAEPQVREKIHNCALFYFKVIIKSLAFSVQTSKDMKPVITNDFRNYIEKVTCLVMEDLIKNFHSHQFYAKRLAYAFGYFLDWLLSIVDRHLGLKLVRVFNDILINRIYELVKSGQLFTSLFKILLYLNRRIANHEKYIVFANMVPVEAKLLDPKDIVRSLNLNKNCFGGSSGEHSKKSDIDLGTILFLPRILITNPLKITLELIQMPTMAQIQTYALETLAQIVTSHDVDNRITGDLLVARLYIDILNITVKAMKWRKDMEPENLRTLWNGVENMNFDKVFCAFFVFFCIFLYFVAISSPLFYYQFLSGS